MNNMKPRSLQLVAQEQVLALQQQMAENQAASWRKLKRLQEAQQGGAEAALVRKLQAKVNDHALRKREGEDPWGGEAEMDEVGKAEAHGGNTQA